MRIFLFTLLLFPVSISAQFIHRDGRVLRDGENKEIKLNGVNLGGWLLWEGWIWGGKFQPQTKIFDNMAKAAGQQQAMNFRDEIYRHYISEDDIRKISEMKLNVVRVPFNHRIFDTAACNAIGWQVLDSLLGWCAKYNVYAVLDMHGAPGGQSPYFIADPVKKNLWKSETEKLRTIDLWKKIAARYKDNRWVAGYDLLNEPIPTSDKELLALYNRIIPAIREVDKNHLLFLEGSNFAKKFSVFTLLPDPNMAFSFHIYTWFGGKPEDKVDAYVELGKRLNAPIWCGEWGENNYEIVENTLKVLNDRNNAFSGWSFWTWKKVTKPKTMPALNGIVMSNEWLAFIDWCCKPKGAKPAAADAQRLMKEFEKAMLLPNCRYDGKLGKLLGDYGAVGH